MWIDRLIGERIRMRRETVGVSVESISERTRIDPVALRAYEAGRKRMQRRDLFKIVQALDISPEDLLDGDDPRPGRGFPRISFQRDMIRISHPE